MRYSLHQKLGALALLGITFSVTPISTSIQFYLFPCASHLISGQGPVEQQEFARFVKPLKTSWTYRDISWGIYIPACLHNYIDSDHHRTSSHTHTHTHTRTHARTHARIHTYIHTYIHTNKQILLPLGGHAHLAEPGCLCTKQALGACASKLMENGLGTCRRTSYLLTASVVGTRSPTWTTTVE